MFVALDCKTRAFVCLKDTWRVDHVGIDPEGKVLQLLNELHISNVPTLCVHGDVEDQHSHTDELWVELCSNDDFESPFRKHTHYRIVEVEVCLPLSEFRNGRELLEMTDHCVKGTYRSFERGVDTEVYVRQLIRKQWRKRGFCIATLVRVIY